MNKWVSVKDGMPNEEIACVVLRRDMNVTEVYPRFVEWDGTDWVDIDGDPVSCVIAWTAAPAYDAEIEGVLSKIAGCVENDKCEEKDCCYFVTADLFERLLEYINK